MHSDYFAYIEDAQLERALTRSPEEWRTYAEVYMEAWLECTDNAECDKLDFWISMCELNALLCEKHAEFLAYTGGLN